MVCRRFLSALLRTTALLLMTLGSSGVRADLNTARGAMEDDNNPLLMLSSSRGALYLELFPEEAPQNVSHFMALAEGEVEMHDPLSGTLSSPPYYDGMRFHRVIPGFVIQAGAPRYQPLVLPERRLPDEINATSLGLDQLPVLAGNGSFHPLLNITSQGDFARRVLTPLYRQMDIRSVDEMTARQLEIVERLQSLSVMQLYQYQGFEYHNRYPTRPITRGILALANAGPNRNGAEFFIALANLDWLNGRYTVIGRVTEGMEIADSIGTRAVDPDRFDPESTTIHSIIRVH